MRILSLLFGLTGVLMTAQLPAQTPKPADAKKQTGDSVYWVGRVSEVNYRWTEQDLTATVRPTGKPVYSVARELKKVFGKPDDDGGVSYYEVRFRPLSVIGSLLSFERDDYYEGGAHPSGFESFVTVDVRNPARHVQLTDLFDAGAIRQALLSDPIVQHILTREKIAPPPTLEGLVKAIANKEFGGEMDGMYSIPQSLLSDFAFHHVEHGKAAVRLLLPHGSEIFRFHHTQLGLLLPLPASRKAAFMQAANGAAGALMPAMQKAAHGRMSTVVLTERSVPK